MENVAEPEQRTKVETGPTIPSMSPETLNGTVTDTSQTIATVTVELSSKVEVVEENVPSPPSPVGSDSWQCQDSMLLEVNALLSNGVPVARILQTICPNLQQPPEGWSDMMMMSILAEILEQPPKREKLSGFNTFEDAIELFRTRKRILILTGAGVSVSCGIPDFRSKNGIYARLHVDFPDLPDPTAMFDIHYFRNNPKPFYNFAKEIFPGQFEPSISHKFIRELEKSGQLLRNYTQNIDTLENQTGIERVVECHGSFSHATCLSCRTHFDGNVVQEDVMAMRVAKCPECKDGIIKPDIVFFGEDLPEAFHKQMVDDKPNVDLLVVIGSSLKVRPVSLIPFSVAPDVPQILINREPLPHYTADIELLGNCDEIVRDICLELGGNFIEMLKGHDARLASKSEEKAETSASYERRTLVTENWFREKMDKLEEQDEDEEKEADTLNESDEPEVKRMRLAAMYQRRYIPVESHIPEDSYFQFSPNRAVFPGAELHFDMEYKAFARLPPPRRRSDTNCSTSSDCSSSSGSGIVRGGSEPPDFGRSDSSPPSSRPASCEPSVDTDTTISSHEFLRSLEENCDSPSH